VRGIRIALGLPGISQSGIDGPQLVAR